MYRNIDVSIFCARSDTDTVVFHWLFMNPFELGAQFQTFNIDTIINGYCITAKF